MSCQTMSVPRECAPLNSMEGAVDRFGPKLPPGINLLNMQEWYYVLEYRKHRELGK